MMIPLLMLSAIVLSPSNLLSWMSHSHRQQLPDTRVTVRLQNPNPTFVDVAVDGQIYTVPSHHTLDVKGPAGVAVVAASKIPGHHRGDVLVILAPLLDETTVELR